MNEIQRKLFERLRKIKNDETFVKAIMLFAMNAECEKELIDEIDKGNLTEENDFYQLLQLIFEENNK